jgi:hypothetical protein
MTTTYSKSLSSDLGGDLNTSQLRDEINGHTGINPECLGLLNTGDDVKIIFATGLDGSELTALDGVVGGHVPAVVKPRASFFSVTPERTAVYWNTYTKVALFEYGGTNNVGEIDYIDVTSRMDSGLSSYDLRVINRTNNYLIAEKTGITNTTIQINDLGSIDNLPENQEMLEIQARRVGGSGNQKVEVKAISVYYGN